MTVSTSDACPICGLIRTLGPPARPYLVGSLFGPGRLGAAWNEHGNPVKGDVGAMMLHLCAAAEVAYGRSRYAIKFLLEHDHLHCEIVPVENGKE